MAKNKLVIDVDANTKLFDKQMTYIERRMEVIDEMLSDPKGFQLDEISYAKLEKEQAQLSKQYSDIIRKKNELERSHVGENLAEGFKKATKSATKLALGIFGIRSAYNMVKRASSAYLSQDTELANKLQSVWVGLGSYLAPVIEKISNLMLKALGYFNVFIKALTGVDYIANANAKALDKQAKAQANLNKQTQQYDFDVVRTQQDTSGGGVDTGSPLVDIPQLNEGLVAKLQNLATWLRENKELAIAVGVALGATFGAIAISGFVSNIATLIGVGGKGAVAGTGLAGLAGLLLFVADVFVVTLVVQGIDNAITKYKELVNQVKAYKEQAEKNTETVDEINEKFWDFVESGEATNDTLESHISWLEKTKQSTIDEMKYEADQIRLFGEHSKVGKQHAETLRNLAKRYESLSNEMEKLRDSGYTTKDSFDDLETTLYNLTKSPWMIDVVLNTTENWHQGSSTFTHSGGGRHFATGGIVTQPTRALIGEAGYPEAVVPIKEDYLTTLASEIAKYSGSGSGGTVNVYLDGKLIQRQMSKVEQQRKFATNG